MSSIPLWAEIIVPLFSYLFWDSWVVSRFGLITIVLQWAWEWRSLLSRVFGPLGWMSINGIAGSYGNSISSFGDTSLCFWEEPILMHTFYIFMFHHLCFFNFCFVFLWATPGGAQWLPWLCIKESCLAVLGIPYGMLGIELWSYLLYYCFDPLIYLLLFYFE